MMSQEPSPPYYWIVFDSPQTWRIFYETDDTMANLTNVYAKGKVPEPMQKTFLSTPYHISLTPDKELIIQKQQDPLTVYKENRLRQAYDYANSPAVDANLINGVPVVINTMLRLKIKERIHRTKEKGNSTDTLTFKNLQITLPITTIEAFLNAVTDRAIANYEVLQQHIANLSTLHDKHALDNYNHTEGYIAPLSLHTQTP